MKVEEKRAFAKLVRHMQGLQKQITKPSAEDATDEEVLSLFNMFWEWTPNPRYSLPSKHTLENLVGLMRGLNGYCYISRHDVARIIRKESQNIGLNNPLTIILNKGADKMDDVELYDNGKWNYKPTAFVQMLYDLHHRQGDFRDL